MAGVSGPTLSSILWEGSDSFTGLLSRAFVAEGRIGNTVAGGGTFELDIGQDTAAPYQTADYPWDQSAKGHPFEVSYSPYDPEAPEVGLATFDNNGTVLTYPDATWTSDTDNDTIFVRTRAVRNNSQIVVGNLELYTPALDDFVPVPTPADPESGPGPASVQAIGPDARNTLQIVGVGLRDGFTLRGRSYWTFQTTPPDAPSQSQLAFQVYAGAQQDTYSVASVVYLPTGKGTTGDLSNDNPDGDGITRPAFAGGWRFFPDAATYATRTVSRNRVRIRATVMPAQAGVQVHFRSFDVDDPSADMTIDPNGGDGSDNRGTVEGMSLDQPGLLAMGGYRGRLRRVGGGFAMEGGIVSVPTVIDAAGNAVAEVELATSFNPGDNFRVAANTNHGRVQNLNDTTSVPTTGPIAGFTAGAVSDQLSVWRRFHVEQDRMASIPWQGPIPGMITAVAAGGTPFERVLTTNINIPGLNQFNGGSARRPFTAGMSTFEDRYLILSHTMGANAQVTVELPFGAPVPAAGDPITLTQGDFQAGNATAVGAPVRALVEITTDLRISKVNEYAGGILRIGGNNYHVVSNTSNALGTLDDKVTILARAAPAAGPILLFQDDSSPRPQPVSLRGEYVSATELAAGRYEITTDIYIPEANFFVNGLLRDGLDNYPIVAHTVGANAKVTVMTGGLRMFGTNITLFANLAGTGLPAPLIDPNSDANVYDMLQPGTLRAQNRYADAYLEPELDALNAFDSNNVTPTSHKAPGPNSLRSLANGFRGTSPGAPPRPADYETDVFWSVYVVTGYEPAFAFEGDPDDQEMIISGATDGDAGATKEISLIFLETLRDRFFNANSRVGDGVTPTQLRTRVAVHEIGHQFQLAVGQPGEHWDPKSFPLNIMSPDAGSAPPTLFFLLPADVVTLRRRTTSPGS